MAQKIPYGAIIIGIIILGALFSAGPILTGLGNLGNALRGWLNEDWLSFGTGAGNSTAVGFSINYTDGTSEQFTPESVLPLEVIYNGKAIKEIGFNIWIKLDYTGEAKEISYDATTYLKLDGASKVRGESDVRTTTTVGASGSWFQLAGGGAIARTPDIDTWATTGRHELTGEANVQLTLKHDSKTAEMSGEAKGSITLEWVQNPVTLSVELRPRSIAMAVTPLS